MRFRESTHCVDAVIPDTGNKVVRCARSLVLWFARSRTCAEVDVDGVEGQMITSRSASEDLEASISNEDSSETLWTFQVN